MLFRLLWFVHAMGISCHAVRFDLAVHYTWAHTHTHTRAHGHGHCQCYAWNSLIKRGQSQCLIILALPYTCHCSRCSQTTARTGCMPSVAATLVLLYRTRIHTHTRTQIGLFTAYRGREMRKKNMIHWPRTTDKCPNWTKWTPMQAEKKSLNLSLH